MRNIDIIKTKYYNFTRFNLISQTNFVEYYKGGKRMGISVDSKLKEVLANPEARAIVEEIRPGFASHPMLKMALGMKFSALIKFPQAGFSEEEIQLLTEKLNALGKQQPGEIAEAEKPKIMDFSSVKGKVVIVTGASRGIGEAIARCYAAHGMKVVCANRDAIKGRQVVDSIKAAGGEASYFRADTSRPAEVKALVDFAVSTYGRLDGIVNNSGMGMGGTPIHEYTVEDCERILDLNLKGVFAGMKYGAEAIFKSKSEGGFIINIASIAGLMPQSGMGLYVATKQGVVGMTRSAAMEYAPYNLTVNAICPGHTLTSMYDVAPPETMDFFIEQIPAGRMGRPEECAWLALFLASDMARFITGAAIPVDGGIAAGQRNILMWRHPELVGVGDGRLSSDSTIAAIMEVPEGAAIVEKYLPGFSENEQAKMAYGLTFKELCEIPMTGISEESAKKLFKELDELGKN
jgi:NAD(P)-dependent dehydrogenase (short-subunit alcohol dehydrogenase family)